MKKDGIFANWIKASVEKKRRRYAGKSPDLFTDQKNQIWYMMMNQLDGAPAGNGEPPAPPEK